MLAVMDNVGTAYDAVKGAALKVQGLAAAAIACFACAQSPEILCSLGHVVDKQLHDDAPSDSTYELMLSSSCYSLWHETYH